MRFDLPPIFRALMLSAVAAAACGVPDEPKYGAPGSILGRRPPAGLGDAPAGATQGTDGGTTTPVAGECVEASFIKEPNCQVKWSTGLFPKMQDTGAWHCSTATCHGGTSTPPQFASTTAKETWDALRAHKNDKNVPYINPCSTDPAASYILANFRGQKGTQMPVPADPAGTADVETWVKCGSPVD